MRKNASSFFFRHGVGLVRQRCFENLGINHGAINFASRCMGTWPKIRPKRIRVITMDITGTLVSFRGSLRDHYLGTAEKCGVDLPDHIPIKAAFAQAYKECSQCKFCRDLVRIVATWCFHDFYSSDWFR